MKKRISLLMALILFIACLSGVVNATEYIVKMSLTSDSYLVPGDTVVVNLKISEIDLGDGISEGDGISGIQAVLEYDENVFEEVTEDSFEGMNGWNNLMYYQEMVTAYRNDQVALPNDLLTITLKVKDSASVDSTSIKLKEIIASGTIGTGLQFKPTGDIEVEDVTVTINKKTEVPAPEVNETVNEEVNNTKNEIAGGNTNTNTNANKINTNTNKNESAGKLPQTGEGIEVALGIAVISIIAVIAYSKYRNINI